MLVLPTSTVPALRRPVTTCASYGAVKFASIREPQVVRSPAVMITSLCAIGTPASGGASPCRERRVGRARLRERAVRVDGDERVEPALRAVDAREQRLRQFDAGEPASRGGPRRAGRRFRDHCGPSYSMTFGTRYRLSSTAGATPWNSACWSVSRDGVVAQRQHHVLRVRHRDDAGGVDRLQLVDQREDRFELAMDFGRGGGVDLDAREMGDAVDVGEGQGHGARAGAAP